MAYAELALTTEQLDALETAHEATRYLLMGAGQEDLDSYLRTWEALRELENLLQDHGRRPRRWATERYTHPLALDPAASTA